MSSRANGGRCTTTSRRCQRAARVKALLRDRDMPERDLREALRKLDSAGLAQRAKAT